MPRTDDIDDLRRRIADGYAAGVDGYEDRKAAAKPCSSRCGRAPRKRVFPAERAPLIRGGQGRDGRELCGPAVTICAVIGIAACLLGLAAGFRWIVEGFSR